MASTPKPSIKRSKSGRQSITPPVSSKNVPNKLTTSRKGDLEVMSLERNFVKIFERKITSFLENFELTHTSSKLFTTSVTEYTQQLGTESLFGRYFNLCNKVQVTQDNLNESLLYLLRQNFLGTIKNFSETLKLGEHKNGIDLDYTVQQLLMEKMRCYLAESFSFYLSSYQNFTVKFLEEIQKTITETDDVLQEITRYKANILERLADNFPSSDDDMELAKAQLASKYKITAPPILSPRAKKGPKTPRTKIANQSLHISAPESVIKEKTLVTTAQLTSTNSGKPNRKNHHHHPASGGNNDSPGKNQKDAGSGFPPKFEEPSLAFGLALSNARPDIPVPLILYEAVKHLEATGLKQVGLFRIAGDKKRIEEIIEGINEGNPVSFVGETDQTVCSVIKLFFRTLPSPIIPFELFDEAINLAKYSKAKAIVLPQVKNLIESLPTVNSIVLYFFLLFLRKIAAQSAINQMPISNLSSVIAPTLLYRKNIDETKIVEDSLLSIKFIQVLLENIDFVFQNIPRVPIELEHRTDIDKLCEIIKFTFDYLVDNIEDIDPNEDDEPNQTQSIIESLINDANWQDIFRLHFSENPRKNLLINLLKSLLSLEIFYKPFDWFFLSEWTPCPQTDIEQREYHSNLLRNKLKRVSDHSFSIISSFVNSINLIKSKKGNEFCDRFAITILPLFFSNIPQELSSITTENFFYFLELLISETDKYIATLTETDPNTDDFTKFSAFMKLNTQREDLLIRRQRSRRANPNLAALISKKITSTELLIGGKIVLDGTDFDFDTITESDEPLSPAKQSPQRHSCSPSIQMQTQSSNPDIMDGTSSLLNSVENSHEQKEPKKEDSGRKSSNAVKFNLKLPILKIANEIEDEDDEEDDHTSTE